MGAIFTAGGVSSTANPAELTPEQQAFREIYKELVEINTTDSVGDTVKSAEAMAARLRGSGIPAADIHVISSGPRKGNIVARLRGTGARKPILLIAHMDVVEAKREDWVFDPFKLQEVDGFFRARGSFDDKSMASIFVANLIEYAKEGFKPDRDIILALTADEELSDSPHDGWPGVPVMPIMLSAATDSRWLRNAGIPSYGVSGLFGDPITSGTHGLNEQVGVKELYDSKEYLYRLIKRLAAPSLFSQH